jgi:uncharacterized protein (TIGR03435 family)
MRVLPVCVLLVSLTLLAQPEPAFEVVSLKRNTSLSDMGGGGPLLRERLSLAAHVEQRDLPVYLLALLRPGRQLGPGLERSTFDCTNLAARKEEVAAAAAARPGRMLCGFTIDTGTLDGGATTMATLAQILTGQAGRPVLDRTGLSGTYNVSLKWKLSLGTDAPTGDAVSIFTAVQEQLGLKLESAIAALDVVVIDRIERPSEN